MKRRQVKVIFIAGHPYAGKSTAAEAIKRRGALPAHVCYFAEPLKDIAHTLAGLSKRVRFDHYEYSKDMPCQDLPLLPDGSSHYTPREFYIHVDGLLKAGHFNEGMYGTILYKRYIQHLLERNEEALILIPDSGFAEAAARIMEFLGAENCIKFNIDRPAVKGNLPHDSRKPWSLPNLQERSFTNTDISWLRRDVCAVADCFFAGVLPSTSIKRIT